MLPTPVTIASLQSDYTRYLQAQNPAINATAPNTYWDIQSGAMAGTLLDLYNNLSLVQNSIYVQNSVGNQCDLWLYSRGLPARGGQTYATINVNITSSTPVTIPANVVFTDSTTTNQYQTLQEVTATDGTTVITLYAVNPGNNYLEPVDATLTAGSVIATVLNSQDGQLLESDQSCINRALQSIRVPQGGSRTTDYAIFALESNSTLPNPVVTGSIEIPAFISINNVNILGVFILQGTSISEYQLNQGLLPATSFVGYTRETSSGVIANANNYIQSQRLVGLNVHTGTCITYQITTALSTLNINVSLVTGYVLSTPISLISQGGDNLPVTITLTVEQLIQREARRAICNQPFGGVNIAGQNYVTIDSIVYGLNLQLSAFNGQIAQILTNVTISNGDFAVPNYDYSATDVYYTYDVTEYSDIVVSQT